MFLILLSCGAAPTYIVSENNKVSTISCNSIPVGMVENNEYLPITKKFYNNDIIVMISDGVVKDDDDVNDNYFINILKKIDRSLSASEIGKILEDEVLSYNKNTLKDDVTIIVNKIILN